MIVGVRFSAPSTAPNSAQFNNLTEESEHMCGGKIMFALGMILVAAADNGGMRLTLLLLLLLAVVLIIAGGVIALLTLMSKRKASSRNTGSAYLESKRP